MSYNLTRVSKPVYYPHLFQVSKMVRSTQNICRKPRLPRFTKVRSTEICVIYAHCTILNDQSIGKTMVKAAGYGALHLRKSWQSQISTNIMGATHLLRTSKKMWVMDRVSNPADVLLSLGFKSRRRFIVPPLLPFVECGIRIQVSTFSFWRLKATFICIFQSLPIK